MPEFGILSYASTAPSGSCVTNERPGLAPIRVTTSYVVDSVLNDEQPGSAPYIATQVLDSDLDLACQYVERARAEHDFVIIGIHWGVMPLWMPHIQGVLADYERPVAYRLIEAGADLIIGGHPHVPHGVEVYQGKLIVYSLATHLHRLPGSDVKTKRPGPSLSTTSTSQLLDFGSMALRSGVVLRANIALHKIEQAEFIPYRLDENKEPFVVTGNEARGGLGTSVGSFTDRRPFHPGNSPGRVPSGLFG